MTKNIVKYFYQSKSDTSSASTKMGHQTQGLLPFFEHGSGGVFLDIGCHNGDKAVQIGRYIGAKRIFGVDIHSSALAKAKDIGLETIISDLNQDGLIPFRSGSFDCIHAGELIEHIFSPDLLLAELARLLKKGGYGVITTPNLASWRNRLVLLLGWQPFGTEVSTQIQVGNPRAPIGQPVGHIRIFVPRSLTELCVFHNLNVVKIGGRIPFVPVTSATKLFSIVDHVVLRLFPTLSEGLVIKVKRQE